MLCISIADLTVGIEHRYGYLVKLCKDYLAPQGAEPLFTVCPTQAELDAYFAKNEASLKEYGITKNMGHTVNVRHILITPGGEIPDQQEEYTEQQWSACFTRAQAVLDAFLAGDRSEDSFALLALRYSEDSVENVTAGGLFQYVQEGEMEGEFNTWCFAEGREPGQYGIVKTSYGYHIMYFVSAEEMWVTQTRSLYIREESQKIVSGALDSHPVRVEYGRIALGKVKLM